MRIDFRTHVDGLRAIEKTINNKKIEWSEFFLLVELLGNVYKRKGSKNIFNPNNFKDELEALNAIEEFRKSKDISWSELYSMVEVLNVLYQKC